MFFEKLSSIFQGEGTRLVCEVVEAGSGEITVRITPDLGATPSNASEEEANLRALLAVPMTLTGTPAEVDGMLDEHLSKRAPIQKSGSDALAGLASKVAKATEAANSAKPKAAPKQGGEASADSTSGSQESSSPSQSAEPEKAPSLDDSF